MNNEQLHYYCLTIQYKGTDFFGWQIQKNTEKTIQGTLSQALAQICKSHQIKMWGGGRTDAGVHALAQVVKIQIPLALPMSALTKGLNSLLPTSIRVIEARVCEESFHPIHSAFWKEYQYRFYLGTEIPFLGDLMTFYPWDLDIMAMEKAMRLFQGQHNFKNFFCLGTDISSTVRTIYHTKLSGGPQPFVNFPGNRYLQLSFIGNGFLKQMVRLMVGAVWNVGRNKISLEQFEMALNGKTSGKVGEVAPPQGLYLMQINYQSQWESQTSILL